MESPVNESEDIDGVIRQTLSTYKPGSTRNLQGHGFKRVCLQLFGLEGGGKSSLVNSCLCVVNNCPFSNEAGARLPTEPFTTARKEYKLTDTVYMIDNRGLKMTIDARLELSAQLRNLRSTSKVDWAFKVERTVNQLEDRWNNHSMDFIIPVFVYSIQRPFSKDIAKEFSPFMKDAFEITGIFPIVVLMKHKTKNLVNPLEVITELGCQHISVLDNYSTTTNPARNAATDSEVLKFLNICLQEADRGIQKRQNLSGQWEFIKQAADQIKGEMKRQKELQKEELGAIINKKDQELKYKDIVVREKELEISRKATEVYKLQVNIQELTRKLKQVDLDRKKALPVRGGNNQNWSWSNFF